MNLKRTSLIITMILVLVQHIDAQAYPKAMNKFFKIHFRWQCALCCLISVAIHGSLQL